MAKSGGVRGIGWFLGCVMVVLATLASASSAQAVVPQGRSLSSATTTAKDNASSAMVSMKKAIPRFTFSGSSASSNFNLDDSGYKQSMYVMAAPGVIIGTLCGIFAFLFYVKRFKNDQWGGTRPRPGGYSHRERLIPRQMTFMIALVVVSTSMLGYIANSNVGSSVSSFITAIEDKGVTVSDASSSLTSSIFADTTAVNKVLSSNFDNSEVLTSLSAGFEGVQSDVESSKNFVTSFNSWRTTAGVLAFAISIGAVAAGFIGALLMKGKPGMVMAFAGFGGLFFCWISLGVHVPAGVMLADYCSLVSDFLGDSSAAPSDYPGVDAVMECFNSTTIDFPVQQAAEVRANVLATIQAADGCGAVGFTDSSIVSDISSCPGTGTASLAEYQDAWTSALSFHSRIKNVEDCWFVAELLNEQETNVCTDLLRYLDLMTATLILVSITGFGVAYLGVIGYKRFPPPKRRKRKPLLLEQDEQKAREERNAERSRAEARAARRDREMRDRGFLKEEESALLPIEVGKKKNKKTAPGTKNSPATRTGKKARKLAEQQRRKHKK